MNKTTKGGRATGRIDHLDGLRALAVLLVVIVHTSKLLPGIGHYAYERFCATGGIVRALVSASGGGIHGVDLFFVLSGFCLAYPTLRKLHAQGERSFDVRAFFEKRIVRILPPYIIAVVLTGVFYLCVHKFGWTPPSNMAVHVGMKDFFKQLVLLDQKTELLNGVFWTLPVEARWYVLFPAALAGFIAAPRVFIAVLALICVWFRYTEAASIDLGVLPAFLAGIIAADLYVRDVRIARYAAPIGILAFALALGFETKVKVSLFWQIAAFCLVVCTQESAALRKFFSSRPLGAVGAASYSIYLMHFTPLEYTMRAAYPYAGAAGSYALSVAAGVLAGFVFYKLVERPFTEAPLRERCLALVRGATARLTAFLRVNGTVRLADAATLSPVPVVAEEGVSSGPRPPAAVQLR